MLIANFGFFTKVAFWKKSGTFVRDERPDGIRV